MSASADSALDNGEAVKPSDVTGALYDKVMNKVDRAKLEYNWIDRQHCISGHAMGIPTTSWSSTQKRLVGLRKQSVTLLNLCSTRQDRITLLPVRSLSLSRISTIAS